MWLRATEELSALYPRARLLSRLDPKPWARDHVRVTQPALPSLSLLQATIRSVAPSIPAANNLGTSGDYFDLYWLLDYLSFAVDQAYPAHPCRQGCSECCHNQVFRVTEAEWRVAREGLLQLDPTQREGILARAETVYGPFREAMEALAAAWTAGERPDPALHRDSPKTCPALEDGRCSIYAERPAICRAYGYFSAQVEGRPSLLICHQRGPAWVEALEAEGVTDLAMPNWNPVQRQLNQLNASGVIKPLPLWLLEEAQALREREGISGCSV